MARRRKNFIDESDPDTSSADSANNDDADDFHQQQGRGGGEDDNEFMDTLYTNRKKRRRNQVDGKEDAIYGTFAHDHDELDVSSSHRKTAGSSKLRKAQAFVSSKNEVDVSAGQDEEGSDQIENNQDVDDNSASSDPETARSTSTAEHQFDLDEAKVPPLEEATDNPSRRGGLGLGMAAQQGSSSSADRKSVRGLGAGRRGGRGLGLGLGATLSRHADGASDETPSRNDDNPSRASGSQPRRSFMGADVPTKPKPQVKLDKSEAQHFATLNKSGGIGLKLLQKMGWQSGQGLGAEGEGIITPIESKLRPKGAGISYQGFRERTKQALAEDRRKGKNVSDEEDEDHVKRRRGELKGRRTNDGDDTSSKPAPWLKPAKVKKTTVVHKTYEEVLAEAGASATVDAGLGQIVDITGQTLPNLPSTLSLNVSAPTEEERHSLPELRHNLRLLCDTARADLSALAREGKMLQDKKRWLDEAEAQASKAATAAALKIKRMKDVTELVDSFMTLSKKGVGVDDDVEVVLSKFDEPVHQLVGLYSEEYDELKLDEVVVGAITPILRNAWSHWQPLLQPDFLVRQLKKWRTAFKLRQDPAGMDLDVIKPTTRRMQQRDARPQNVMTPFESLLWTYWLPKIRSAVNISEVGEPQPLVEGYVAWQPLLPRFLQDNIFDQLILPRLSIAITDWNPKTSHISLHSIIFPWLQHAGEFRMQDLLDQSKRRIKSWLRNWNVQDGEIPNGLQMWRIIFSKRQWDDLMLKTIVPSLSTMLRDHFHLNPRQQDMRVLKQFWVWTPLLSKTVTCQILQVEFFPKWFDTLWIWLTHASSTHFDQISSWMTWWKNEFPDEMVKLKPITFGFAKGQEMLNQATSLISLGLSVKDQLSKPDLSTNPLSTLPKNSVDTLKKKPLRLIEEVTFRSIVEEEAGKCNLLVMSTNQYVDKTGIPLLKICQSVDGRHGILFYIEDDVVFVEEAGGSWEPTLVADLIELAQKVI